MTTTQTETIEALAAAGFEALAGKGGYWVRDHGHFTLPQLRKAFPEVTFPEPAKRNPVERQAAWGEFAIVAAMSRGLRK